MSNILRYTDVVMQSVRHLLYDINENEGKVTNAMIREHLKEEEGCYPADSANVALVCIGKQKAFKSGVHANDKEFEILVAQAKKTEFLHINSILRKREAMKAARQ